MANSVIHRILLYERVTAIELLGGQNRIITLENLITALCQSSRLVATLCSLLKISLASLHEIDNNNHGGVSYRRKDNDAEQRKLAEMVWNIGAKRQSSCKVHILIENIYHYTVDNLSSLTSINKDMDDMDNIDNDETNDLPVYRVLYDFIAEGPGELSVSKDTLVLGIPWERIIEEHQPLSASFSTASALLSNPPPEGWLLCIHIKSVFSNLQETGYLPISYLHLVDNELSNDSIQLIQSSSSPINHNHNINNNDNNIPLSPLATVAQSLQAWTNNTNKEITSRPEILTTNNPILSSSPALPSSSVSVKSADVLPPKNLFSSSSSSVSSSLSSSISPTLLTSPVLPKRNILISTNEPTTTTTKVPGPLTVRK